MINILLFFFCLTLSFNTDLCYCSDDQFIQEFNQADETTLESYMERKHIYGK